MCPLPAPSLAGLAVLGLRPELGDLGLDLLVDAGLELRAVAQEEEDLEPDEHGGEEQGLDQVVQEGRGALLKGAVADKLGDPADDVDGDGRRQGRVRILGLEVVAASRSAEAEGGQGEAGDGLQQQVERRVEHGSNGAQVEVKIRHSQPLGQLDEGPRVGRLQVIKGENSWPDRDAFVRGNETHKAEAREQDHGDAYDVDGYIDLVVVVGAILE